MIWYILTIFIIITALFIVAILYLIVSTENLIDDFDPDRTYATFFDNTSEQTFRYKYLVKIVFNEVPKEVEDFLNRKQSHPPDIEIFSITLLDDLKQHIGSVSISTKMLCKYLVPMTVGSKQTLKILVFGRFKVSATNRVCLGLTTEYMRVNIHEIAINDIIEKKSYTFKIDSIIKTLPPNPRGKDKQEFRLSQTDAFDAKTVTRPVTLKNYEYLCYLYMTFSSIISLSIAFFIRTTYFPISYLTDNIWSTSIWTAIYTCMMVIASMSYHRFYLNEQMAKLLNYRYWSRFKWCVFSFIVVSSFVLSCFAITFVVLQCKSSEANCPLDNWLLAIGMAIFLIVNIMTISILMLRRAKFFKSKY